MIRDGIPNELQQPQVSYSALLPYGALVEASTFARWLAEFARMPKSPRTSTHGWLLCTPISFYSWARP